jgi:hypothetical protein
MKPICWAALIALTILPWRTGADPARPVDTQSAAAQEAGRRELAFQEGVDGYAGTIDTELWEVSPNKVLEKNDSVSTDTDNDGGQSQILLRFDDLFGSGPRQIPPGSTIHKARLIVMAFDPGNPVHLHRMLVPWDRSATWNSMVAGVSADDLEAARQADGFTFGRLVANQQRVVFEVTDTVQNWANGVANYGWVFLNTGSNGWDFYASEYEEVASRPQLVVEFTPPAAPAVAAR